MEIRLPTIEDKEIINKYMEEHYINNEHKLHGSNMLDKMDFSEWIKRIERLTKKAEDKWGISDTLIAINEENKMIGIVNIRYNPDNEFLLKSGHIGYGVCPSERRKGIATKLLQKALEKCKEHGLTSVIVGCRKNNIASAKTIIKNGGVLDRESVEGSNINQYYKINL